MELKAQNFTWKEVASMMENDFETDFTIKQCTEAWKHGLRERFEKNVDTKDYLKEILQLYLMRGPKIYSIAEALKVFYQFNVEIMGICL